MYERIAATVAIVLAVFAVGWQFTDKDERDACARLADLGRGVGIDRASELSHEPDVGVTLLRDCLTE
jgi:hypothetical protein